MLETKRKIRILDFDIENRPLSYWISDRPTAEITAIASCWVDDPDSMQVDLLDSMRPDEAGIYWGDGRPKIDGPFLLRRFVERYNEADMVTGHYIRKHDLPIINGALMEFGMPLLQPKLTCDTKLDMKRKADIPASQEYLAALFGLHKQKVHMTQHDWRQANRLTPEGLEAARQRVAGDVETHMEMRLKMVELGLLNSPKVWRS